MAESLVYTGVWTGDMIEEGSGNTQSLLWTLVLVSDSPYPSAYGATGDENPNVIHGKWDNKTKEVQVKEILPGGAKREFTGSLEVVQKRKQLEDGTEAEEKFTLIKGRWECGEKKGKFVACKEQDSSSNISGFWLGRALPSKKLADFCIPINPIRWCATLLTSPLPHSPSTPTFFGCGFFDDSGDVPGQSLLFYSLRGTFNLESRQVEFAKVYESHRETEGYEVEYKGVLEGDGTMRGKWNNKKGGSFGKFFCRKQGTSPKQTSAICICDVCSTAIKPGEVRWACGTCPSLWFCCGSCAREDLTKLHPHALSPEGMYYQDTAQGSCCAEILLDAFSRFGKRDLIGWRLPKAKAFDWLTYDDVFWHTKQILFGMREIGIRPREFVFICADLSPAYHYSYFCLLFIFGDFERYLSVITSTIMQGLVLLPIHGSLGQSEIEHIIRKTNPTLFIVASAYLPKIESAVAAVAKGMAVGVEIKEGMLTKANGEVAPNLSPSKQSGFFRRFLSLEELKEIGKSRVEKKEVVSVERVPKETVSAVLFTSGSTGVPKGAVFTEDLMMPSEGVANVQPFIRVDFQAYDPSFALSILQTMMCGGSRLFSLSLDAILEDFQIGRPTHIGATPIFWNGLYQEFLVRLTKETRINEATEESKRKTRNELVNRVAGQIRGLLGNRLIVATSGGAPISSEVLAFLKTKLRLDIIDLYGSRETGGITRDGVVYPGISVKLKDVPDLGYFSTSFPPQGEICVHSPRLINGYWNDDAITNDSFVEMDGKKYYRTGDIGEMHEIIQPNGKKTVKLKVIDRVSSMLKLSSGEWVSTGHIETIIEHCPWVSQCLVLGSPAHPFTVAVVVPSLLLQNFWRSPRDPATLAQAKTQMLREIRLWAVHHHLRPLQIPQNIYLESSPWTTQNGFLTGTEKKRRKILQARYATIQKALYEHIELNVDADETNISNSLSKEFLDILKTVMPMVPSLSGNETLVSIGGDSLSVARLCNILREKGVEVQLKNIFDYPLSHLSQLLSQATNSIALPMSNYMSINWAAETSLPSHFQKSQNKPGSHVLLTGCTGFFGPVLLAEILAQYPPNVKIYCVVRAKDDEQATARLQKDMETALVWNPSYRERIVPLAGNVAKPKLGLSDQMYSKLISSEVGVVFHSAAWVNMALPYSALKATNVGGTLSVIQFALEAGGALVHFVSSVAAIPSAPPFDSWPTLANYDLEKRDGYGQTKIVSEILLAKAHASFDLPVQISRPSAISGHTKTGFSNKLDFSCLLLQTMVKIGGGVRDSSVLFHWVPVDFVASSIVTLAKNYSNSQNIFNLVSEGPLLRDVIDVLAEKMTAKNEGKPIRFETLSPAQWASKVESSITHEFPALYPLKEQFTNYGWYGAPTYTDIMAASTKNALQNLKIVWHRVTIEDVKKMISYLVNTNIL